MNIKEIIEKLPSNFKTLSFHQRMEEISKLIGPPTKVWRDRPPSGGGSWYAEWDQPEPDDFINLETGGYDMHTERGYPRLPYAGGRRFKPCP